MAKTAPVAMYDSVNPDTIPGWAQVVAGYADGIYAWPNSGWNRFPNAEKVVITVTGESLFANVADVERFNLTPAGGADWIRRKQAAGHKGATIYCNLVTLPAVFQACQGLAYYLMLADWTGNPEDLYNAVAVQFENTTNYDLSMVYSQEWLDILAAADRPWPY